jgi:hypothetical protein
VATWTYLDFTVSANGGRVRSGTAANGRPDVQRLD